MGRFNLLDEPWISVVTKSGFQKDVSIIELFQHATDYCQLAGEMQTQNFAVLRILLAILQTVFSRYDADGKPIVLTDDLMRQTEPIEEDEQEDYEADVKDTRNAIWKRGHFPNLLFQYLETWREHFFLFDDRYPFMQVTRKEMDEVLPEKKKATVVAGRFMNRLISESGNKMALFSPTAGGKTGSHKDVLTNGELVRWLITFQGYTGLSDKTKLVRADQQSSKGWLFDLGGIYLKGDDVFETLMLNFIPMHLEKDYRFQEERPCWESSGQEVMARLRKESPVMNLAELYTNWSRAVYIDPAMMLPGKATIQIAKLPAINHLDEFLEPMTIWRFNESGENKDHYTPKKHRPEQAMWRSFGLIALPTSEEKRQHRPDILSHMIGMRNVLGKSQITICAIAMQDDENATSWVPVDEIADELQINELLLEDESDEGWLVRISDTVAETKNVIENIYRGFLRDIAVICDLDIKSTQGNGFLNRETEEVYQEVDEPFHQWLRQLKPEDSKEEKVLQWKTILRRIVWQRAQDLVLRAGTREYRGIEKQGAQVNIVTAYLKFMGRLGHTIPPEGGNRGRNE